MFLKEESLVNGLLARGVVVKGKLLAVSPLAAPATQVIVSNVPPSIKDEVLVRELSHFGKFASGFKPISLRCRSPDLKHVLSLQRQVLMYLKSPEPTLNVNFYVKHGDSAYAVYATSESLLCFECGEIGHKRMACPRREKDTRAAEDSNRRPGE